jgi:heme-degrading monooxygenase HmoA
MERARQGVRGEAARISQPEKPGPRCGQPAEAADARRVRRPQSGAAVAAVRGRSRARDSFLENIFPEARMVITVLDARIVADRAADLERAYREGTSRLPPDILETFLVRDADDPTRYRIVTVWASQAALQAMRASGVTPKGVQIFQAVGAMPELSVLDVVVHQRR